MTKHSFVCFSTCEWKLRPSCSIAQTVSSKRPPMRVTRASSRRAMARRSTVAKWCTTAIDSTASNDSSRNGRHILSHTTTCNLKKNAKDKLVVSMANHLITRLGLQISPGLSASFQNHHRKNSVLQKSPQNVCKTEFS